MNEGSGFQQGSGFRVQGSGPEEGSGFRVQGSGTEPAPTDLDAKRADEDAKRADEDGKRADEKAEAQPIGFAEVKAFVKRLGPAGPLAIISASMPFVTAVTVLGSLPWVGSWMHTHQQAGGWVYFLSFAALGGVGFMPTHAYSLLGGYAFGLRLGLALALASYLVGGLIAYGIARLASGERVVQIIAEHPKSKAVHDALVGSGFGKTLLITFLVRLTSSPFAITNMVLAATRVHIVAYILATVVGMAPRTGALVYIASKWAAHGQSQVLKKGEPWTATIVFTIVTFIVLLIIGYLGNQAIVRVTAGKPGQRPT